MGNFSGRYRSDCQRFSIFQVAFILRFWRHKRNHSTRASVPLKIPKPSDQIFQNNIPNQQTKRTDKNACLLEEKTRIFLRKTGNL